MGIQGISALVLGRGPLAKVGSSAKFCGVVCRSSLLWYWGVHWPHLVCLPSLVYWYSRHLCSGTGEGAIGQSRVICQLLCSGLQGISALVPRGSIGQSRVICQVLCSGMQVISALVLRGPLSKAGPSAKFCVVVCRSSLLWYWGVYWPV